MRYASKVVAVLLLLVASASRAQTAQELIDLDMKIAAEKRAAELAKLKSDQAGPSRPLVASEPPKPQPETQFHVRGVYGPVESLRALVSYRDSVPVELSMAPNGERELGGWRLTALDTRRVVFERQVAAPPDKNKKVGEAQREWITERVVLPIRVQALPLAPAALPSGSLSPTASPYAPSPLPATVLPTVPGKPQ